jgi:hypothetical protein
MTSDVNGGIGLHGFDLRGRRQGWGRGVAAKIDG